MSVVMHSNGVTSRPHMLRRERTVSLWLGRRKPPIGQVSEDRLLDMVWLSGFDREFCRPLSMSTRSRPGREMRFEAKVGYELIHVHRVFLFTQKPCHAILAVSGRPRAVCGSCKIDSRLDA
nr:hypothetical protein CFP56_28674 [Quercus suber]